MLDAVTIEKMTAYYGSLFGLLDEEGPVVEVFEKALAVTDPERTLRVLRELTDDEAFLLFSDFKMFMGVERRKGEMIRQGGVVYTDFPGGVFLQFLEHQVGIPTKMLLAAAYAEFGEAPEIKDGIHAIRFEIINNVICYVLFEPEKGSRPKDVSTVAVAQALREMLSMREQRHKAAGGEIDLMSWEPGSDKIH